MVSTPISRHDLHLRLIYIPVKGAELCLCLFLINVGVCGAGRKRAARLCQKAHSMRGFCKALGHALQRPGGAHAQLLVQRAPHGASSCAHHSLKLLQANAAALQQAMPMIKIPLHVVGQI